MSRDWRAAATARACTPARRCESTVWRPQRKPITADANGAGGDACLKDSQPCQWVDIGGLLYAAVPQAQVSGGLPFCPQSAFSTTDPQLTPEGIPYSGGAFRDSALVAVSTGLLQTMNREEAEAVLGHEVSHVANGDMVTLTLIQGVVNTFVVFLSRIVGYRAGSRGQPARARPQAPPRPTARRRQAAAQASPRPTPAPPGTPTDLQPPGAARALQRAPTRASCHRGRRGPGRSRTASGTHAEGRARRALEHPPGSARRPRRQSCVPV